MTPTATEIAAWANRRDAQGLMPILLRRLIHGSVSAIRRINFPAGDSIQLGGFDGEVDAERGNAWVPDGSSVWESGCNKAVKAKADSDYRKRVRGTPAKRRKSTTFVFVTPRRWTAKEIWVRRRKGEGKWRDVRCLDADDLEQWAEQTPSAAVWLAERLGSASSGFVSAARYWETWANSCKPPVPQDLVLASRDHQAQSLLDRLLDPSPQSTTIAADTREEALAFACAALACDRGRALADRLLVASASSPIERLTESSDIVLAIQSDALERRAGVLGENVRIIVPRARGETSESADVELESVRSDAFDASLRKLGLSEDRVDKAARESGRSLSILRRRWSTIPGLRHPAWSGDTELARNFVPFALCGAWQSDRDGDVTILGGISGRDKGSLEGDVADLLAIDDSPLEAIGSIHRVVSPVDALFAIGRRITPTDLERYFSLMRRVYSVRDPALDLPEGERWMANVLGKEHPFSGALLRGLGNTLILLAIHGDTICGKRLGISVSGRVHALVRELLSDLTSDQWLSIRGTLQLLAEADPDAFITAIEQDIGKPSPPILTLMRVIGGAVTGSCLRTELLWALELVAWNPKNHVRVAEILARLSREPITDNWANKPFASLLSLFRPWLPKTAASIEQRIDVLRRVRTRFPDVGFNLCVRLVDYRGSAMDNARPRWRDDAAGAGRSVTQREFVQMVVAAADILVASTPRTVDEIRELIIHRAAFPPQYREKIWELVGAWIDSSPSDDDKAAVREIIRRHARLRGGASGRRKAAGSRVSPNFRSFESRASVDQRLRSRHRV